jgi:hypothetical protein
MAGMVSAKKQPEFLYKAFHNIFDPEIPVGEYGLLTVQSMQFYDAQTEDPNAAKPYEIRVYLISHHSIAMYGAEDAEEFMMSVMNDPNVSYSDAWIYPGIQNDMLHSVDFS